MTGDRKQRKANFDIGGYCARMTQFQADAWNRGSITLSMMGRISVHIFTDDRNDLYGRYITLRRATNEKLEPEVARAMDGMPARRCGEWEERTK